MRPLEKVIAEKVLLKIYDEKEREKISTWLYVYLSLLPPEQEMMVEAFELLKMACPEEGKFYKMKYPPREYPKESELHPFYTKREQSSRELKRLFLHVIKYLEVQHFVSQDGNKVCIRSFKNLWQLKKTIEDFYEELVRSVRRNKGEMEKLEGEDLLEYVAKSGSLFVNGKWLHTLQDEGIQERFFSFCWENAHRELSYKEIKEKIDFKAGIFRPKQWIEDMKLKKFGFFKRLGNRALVLRKSAEKK